MMSVFLGQQWSSLDLSRLYLSLFDVTQSSVKLTEFLLRQTGPFKQG